MRIGLTYDLRSVYLALGYSEEETAEFDREDTVVSIEQALKALGHEPVRIGRMQDLVQALARGARWDLVFNICEGLRGGAREAQVPMLLEVYDIPCTFSDAAVTALCLNKAWTKLVVQKAGVPTAAFRVVEQIEQAASVQLDYPLFVKPNAEGTGKGTTADSIVQQPELLRARCAELLTRYHQPVLVEEFLPGREFTVGLLGSDAHAQVLGTLEIELLAEAEAGVYSYLNKEECETRVRYTRVEAGEDPAVAQAETLALDAWRALGCRDAGRIDVRCDARGQPRFIEVNPIAGLHPEHSDLPMLATACGWSYRELIGAIVESACRRIRPCGS